MGSMTKLIADNSGNYTEILEKFRDEHNALLKEVQSGLDVKIAALSENTDVQRQKLDKSELLLGTVIERMHGMDETDERLTERVMRLDEQDEQWEAKIKALEDADSFLQESNRQQTHKVVTIDEECRRIEETFIQFYKEQKQEIDTEIKVNINKLQAGEKAISEKQDDIEKRIYTTDGRLNDVEKISQNSNKTIVEDLKTCMDKLEKTTEDRATGIESSLITYYEKVNANADEIKRVNDELKTLGLVTHENVTNIQNSLNDSEASLNEIISKALQDVKGKCSSLDDKIKHLNENEDNINITITNFEKSVNKVNDNMVKIMEQANTSLLNDAQQDSKIQNLEASLKNMEDKLSSLEKADLYLQESFKQR